MLKSDHLGDFLKKAKEAQEFARLETFRNDLAAFSEYVMRDEKGQPWKLGKHHKEWYGILWDQVKDVVEPDKGHVRLPNSKDNLLLMAPREHGKTSTMVCFLIFILGKNPRLRIKYVSGSEDLAIAVLGQVADNIERNVRLHEVFPHLKKDPSGSWTGSKIDVMKLTPDGEWDEASLGIKDASIQAYGVGAPATGGRADLIIFDDMIRAREAIQEPARLVKISQVFYTDWLNIGGYRHIVVGTPWTPDDIHAQLSNNEDWEVWKKPAIIDGKPLWPERWPIDKLMARKRQIGDTAFALQFMLEGIVQKQQWWSKESIEKCKDPNTKYGQVPADFETDGIVVGFDPAASMRHDGSFSSIFALLYDKMHRKCVYRIIHKRAAPREMAEAMVNLLMEIEATLTRKVEIVTVENNATQQAFVDLINLVCENRGLNLKVPIIGQFTGTQKWNPELGLPRMVGDFDAGKWIIPWGDKNHQGKIDPLHECDICSWISEMVGYPYDTPTTDMIMGSWLASQAVDKPTIGDLPAMVRKTMVNVTNVNWG